MKTVIQWLIGIVIVLGIGVGIFFGVGAIIDKQMADDEPESFNSEEEKRVKELSEEKFANSKNAEDLNSFGDRFDVDALSDAQVQEYIHKMSHQKVKASEKWGFYRITDERIAWLLEGVNMGKEDLQHYNLYKSILERWSAGDFSRADEDHNAIWNLQGGTIGRATGVLSAEEEQAYINRAYEN